MITRIEALNFRCLRYVSQPLDKFHVLVGPNGSGKSSFLDVVGFVSRLLNDGLEAAIEEVTPNPLDMVFGRKGSTFELAIEARLPDDLPLGNDAVTLAMGRSEPHRIRYEVSVVLDKDAYPVLDKETVKIVPIRDDPSGIMLGHQNGSIPSSILSDQGTDNVILRRNAQNTEYFHERIWDGERSRYYTASLSSDRSALANLIEDLESSPDSIWFKKLVKDGIGSLMIDSNQIRRPSPPADKRHFQSSGRSMPWVMMGMEEHNVQEWIEHVQTALPEIVGIRSVIREEDRHCYLMLKYNTGVEVPQWMVSDGTLRLLALTLPAFLDEPSGILLVEEPENGLHPKALETVFQALSYIPDRQVLITTHSPQLLMLAGLPQILCFAKDSSGGVDIVSGDRHPTLKDWQHDISLGTLFAAGALE